MSKNVAQLTEELEQSKTREHLLGKELRSLQVILDNVKWQEGTVGVMTI